MSHRILKPEDFRERIIDMVKRGLLRTEMIRELDCKPTRFYAWFSEEFPGVTLRNLKNVYRMSGSPRPGNNRWKEYKPLKPMTDTDRIEAQRRVREAQQDFLPRLAVPVRTMTDEEFKRMS